MFIVHSVLCVLVPLSLCDMLKLNDDILLDLEFAKQFNMNCNLAFGKRAVG